jgi:hypothetical protein
LVALIYGGFSGERGLKNSLENFGSVAFQGVGDLEDFGNGRVAGTLLDITDINRMYVGDSRQFFLGPFPFQADGSEVFA